MLALGRPERVAFWRLSPRGRAIVAGEFSEPESRTAVLEILRSPDPNGTLARHLVRDAALAFRTARVVRAMGLGDDEDDVVYSDGLGRFSLKKHFKRMVKGFKKTAIQSIHRIEKVGRKVGKVAKKIWVKYGGIILMIVGGVLAIVLPGVGAVIAGVLVSAASAANTVYQNKRKADAAKAAGKKEAAQMAAEVSKQEADLNRQADDIYKKYPTKFQALGITWTKWSSLSVEAKLKIIDAMANGKLPPGYTEITEAQAAAAGAPGAVAPSTAGPTTAPSTAPSTSAPTATTSTTSSGPSSGTTSAGPSGPSSSVPSGSAPDGAAPSDGGGPGTETSSTQEAAPSGGGGGVLPVLLLVGGVVAVAASGGKKR